MGCLACLAVAFAVAPALSARALTTASTLGRPQAETRSLNADWRFSWADETIPLKKAMASMAKGGVAVSDPAYDDGAWESVSLPHPVNAHDSFDDRAVRFRCYVASEGRRERPLRRHRQIGRAHV